MDADDDLDAKRERRRIVRIGALADQGKENDLEGTTVQERLDMMERLAIQAWAFMGIAVEEPLQRHVVRIIRRKRGVLTRGGLCARESWPSASNRRLGHLDSTRPIECETSPSGRGGFRRADIRPLPL